MKLKLNEERLYPTDLVKYIGAKIDSKSNWKNMVDQMLHNSTK